MRKRKQNTGISIHAIAGTEVVLLGLNATEKAAKDLLGFSIYKRKGKTGKEYPLGAGKIFEGIHREAARGKTKSDVAPIQAFMWSDYSADPKTTYTYRVVPMYGEPGSLKPGKGVEVTITTEDPDDRTHAIYFNRGVAGSQAYSRHFGKYRKWYKVKDNFGDNYSWTEFVRPEDVPEREAFKWLSRGLEEAMLKFIRQAKGERYSLHAALYELTHPPVIQAFVDSLESGADVKIVHHYKEVTSYQVASNREATVTVDYEEGNTEGPSPPPPLQVSFKNKELRKVKVPDGIAGAADEAVLAAGLDDVNNSDAYDAMLIPRRKTTISHNKFIVLLKDGKPIEVWTGSTNLTAGGIFGQSNVGHVVRDEKVAQKYHDYWQQLNTDPDKSDMRNWTADNTPDIKGEPRPNSITPIFSPRPNPPTKDGKPTEKTMLDWYAERLAAAKSSVHFTAAFTVANQIFEKVTKKKRTSDPYLRYLLLEGIGGLMRKKYPVMKKCPQNRIAWGDTLESRDGSEELIETLTGLNDHVNYLHTKYMLIDPLTDDPVVITGSANFSNASTVNNDENMLVIRGNTRVADIFLGEFMRLFNHFHSRNVGNARSDEEATRSHYLKPNDSWTAPYFDDKTQEYQQRLLFS